MVYVFLPGAGVAVPFGMSEDCSVRGHLLFRSKAHAEQALQRMLPLVKASLDGRTLLVKQKLSAPASMFGDVVDEFSEVAQTAVAGSVSARWADDEPEVAEAPDPELRAREAGYFDALCCHLWTEKKTGTRFGVGSRQVEERRPAAEHQTLVAHLEELFEEGASFCGAHEKQFKEREAQSRQWWLEQIVSAMDASVAERALLEKHLKRFSFGFGFAVLPATKLNKLCSRFDVSSWQALLADSGDDRLAVWFALQPTPAAFR